MASVLASSALPQAPYPGLRPFEASEWRIFFGREAMARAVIDLVYERRFVMIHGASGSGKSSLIKAGVLPGIEIEQRLSGGGWMTDTLKPSEGPLTRLEQILEARFPAAEYLSKQGGSVRWMDEIHKGASLLAAIEQAVARNQGGRLFLLIDQFEELFRLSGWSAPAEAELFVEILNRAAEPDNGAPSVSMILTMRSDYLGHCARFDGFAETVNRCQYLLPKMDDFGLLQAIHKPAALFHGAVSEAAADALLRSTSTEADRLPVLQHALMRAWRSKRDRPQGWVLDTGDLDAIGGPEGPLGRHADTVLAEALDAGPVAGRPARAEALEWMFRSLTDLDADGLGVRRTRRFADLVDVAGSEVDKQTVRGLIDRFRDADCSFLAPYGDAPLADDAAVEISHEALIRKWGRLSDKRWEGGRPRGWIWREFQDGQTWRALAVLSQDHGSVLGPGPTEQRLPWFATIRKRPAWTRRYAVGTPGDGAAPGSELTEVAAMFDRSRRSLSHRRWRPVWISAAVILAMGLASVPYLVAQHERAARLALKAQAADAEAAKQTSLAEQANDSASKARNVGLLLIRQTCQSNYKNDAAGAENCVSALQKLYPENTPEGSYPSSDAGGGVAPPRTAH